VGRLPAIWGQTAGLWADFRLFGGKQPVCGQTSGYSRRVQGEGLEPGRAPPRLGTRPSVASAAAAGGVACGSGTRLYVEAGEAGVSPVRGRSGVSGTGRGQYCQSRRGRVADKAARRSRDKTVSRGGFGLETGPISRGGDKTVSRSRDKTVSHGGDKTVSRSRDKTVSRSRDKTVSRGGDKTVSRSRDKTVSRSRDKTVSRGGDKTVSRGGAGRAGS
jgi:hypothetical protein